MITARLTSPTTLLVSNDDAGWFVGRAPTGSLLVLEVAGAEHTVRITARENLYRDRAATRDRQGRIEYQGPQLLGHQITLGDSLDAPIGASVLIVGYAHPEVSR